jgi:hypothetical protein
MKCGSPAVDLDASGTGKRDRSSKSNVVFVTGLVLVALGIVFFIGSLLVRRSPNAPFAAFWWATSKPSPTTAGVSLEGSQTKESSTLDRKRFEQLYRAGKAIQGATGVGVNLSRFAELTQALATEILMAKDSATSDAEVRIVALYASALVRYQDSLTLWQAKVSSAPHYVSSNDPTVAPLIAKYGLPVGGPNLNPDVLHTDQSLQLLWATAIAELNKAELIYLGRG